ncbi:hypothetical protein RRSWK_06587 [Rhodopirellula sp. SWK7]|nr:hypothetical protein RRSWK_06587 [Rhodopirellula sp. SWK7]
MSGVDEFCSELNTVGVPHLPFQIDVNLFHHASIVCVMASCHLVTIY